MNDRFKFRGYWYNDTQKEWWVFDEPEFITGDGTAEIWSDTEGGAYPELYPGAELHLCQCTGLKDKNGKLIYEGDIVATIIKNLDGKTIIDTPEVVEYDENLCMFRTYFSTLSKQTEVIGNIYQNKELLNENS